MSDDERYVASKCIPCCFPRIRSPITEISPKPPNLHHRSRTPPTTTLVATRSVRSNSKRGHRRRCQCSRGSGASQRRDQRRFALGQCALVNAPALLSQQ